MRVVLNRKLCSGHARCIEIGPDVYASDEMGFCVLKYQRVPEHLEEQACVGAANCPEGALAIVEDDAPPESATAKEV